jgi:hypothetical protein
MKKEIKEKENKELDEKFAPLFEERDRISDLYVQIVNRAAKGQKEKDQINFIEKNYYPLDVLKDFIGENVKSITFFCKNGKTETFFSEGLDEITNDGHYDHSSERGLLVWNNKTKNYESHIFGSCEQKDYVGIKEASFFTYKEEQE